MAQLQCDRLEHEGRLHRAERALASPAARACPGRDPPVWRRRGGQDGRGREAMDFALSDTQAAIRREALALARTFPLEYWRERVS